MKDKPKMKAYRAIKFKTIVIFEGQVCKVCTLLDDQTDQLDAKDLESAHTSSLYELCKKKFFLGLDSFEVYSKERIIWSSFQNTPFSTYEDSKNEL